MTTISQKVRLGAQGPMVFPLALGCMGMGGSSFYGDHDEAEGIATIHCALERGVNLLDTGDFYGMGRNELLVGRALAGRRDRALLSVKFGALRGPDGAVLGYDARPSAVKNFLSYSLSRLGVDYVDIYRPSRLDPLVPIEDTIGAIADLVKAGYVRYIGVSELGTESIRRAASVHPLVDLQIEYSLLSRGPETAIFPEITSLGIACTAYGTLSRGLLTGSRPTSAKDLRGRMPRFAGPGASENQALVHALAHAAAERGVSSAQMAIAWVLAKNRTGAAPTLVPTIGARTRAQLETALGALDVALTPSEVAALETAVPASAVVGTRYPEAQMGHLDSERG
jgi:aryl-alcohol dehydrogenase-like predicted oxidoreductase